MSASEKLKALKDEATPETMAVYHDVHPQLVAVVKAQERWLLRCPRCGGTGQEPFDDDIDSSQNPWVRVSCDLCGDSHAALAALDKALS